MRVTFSYRFPVAYRGTPSSSRFRRHRSLPLYVMQWYMVQQGDGCNPSDLLNWCNVVTFASPVTIRRESPCGVRPTTKPVSIRRDLCTYADCTWGLNTMVSSVWFTFVSLLDYFTHLRRLIHPSTTLQRVDKIWWSESYSRGMWEKNRMSLVREHQTDERVENDIDSLVVSLVQ